MTEDFISIGRVISTHGLKGRLKVITDGSILLEYGVGLKIRFQPDLSSPLFNIFNVSNQKTLIIGVEEISNLETAEKFIGLQIYIQKSQVPELPTGEYYNFQILGLKPSHADTVIPGFTVVNVLDNPVHPIIEFSDGEASILIPFVEKYIGQISLQKGEIEVKEWQVWLDAL